MTDKKWVRWLSAHGEIAISLFPLTIMPFSIHILKFAEVKNSKHISQNFLKCTPWNSESIMRISRFLRKYLKGFSLLLFQLKNCDSYLTLLTNRKILRHFPFTWSTGMAIFSQTFRETIGSNERDEGTPKMKNSDVW